jgi:hypothetical protein
LSLLFSGHIFETFAADVNVLIIGSSRDSSERYDGSGWWNSQKPFHNSDSVAFSPNKVGTELKSILSGAGIGSVNVVTKERYQSATNHNGYPAYSYNLASWFHFPYPAGVETSTRWPDLRGENGTAWDYVILIGDPYTMEHSPGMYAYGVAQIGLEVAKGSAEMVLLMPWQGQGSSSSINHYKEVVYRAGRSGGYKVVPAGLAWQTANQSNGSAHPTNNGAYIAAASIYSRLWNKNASTSSYNYNNSLANIAFNSVSTNKGAEQYTGIFSFQNPYLMESDKRRDIHLSSRGTSTEWGFRLKLLPAIERIKMNHNEGSYVNKYSSNTPEDDGMGWPANADNPISFNLGRDGFYSEAAKSYVVNPNYWQLAYGFYYQADTSGLTDDQKKDVYAGLIQMQDQDLANRMINEQPSARNVPLRTLWSQIHKYFPDLRPLRDSTHLSYETDEAAAAYMITLYSGRCPLGLEPEVTDKTWVSRKIGYETAWMMGRCQTRAPGFKVMPSSADAHQIQLNNNEVMKVQFILEPKNNVTVNVSLTDPSQGIISPKELVFTPNIHDTAQRVTFSPVWGSQSSKDIEVKFNTQSNDEVYNDLNDTWKYTVKRTNTQSVTYSNTADVSKDTYKNTSVVINLQGTDGGSFSSIYAGPHNGTINQQGSTFVYTPNNGYVGQDSVAYAVLKNNTVTKGYAVINIIGVIPNDSVEVSAIVASASETGTESGTYKIIRSGDTSLPLDVNFSLNGSAVNGVDYNLSVTNPVTIPANQGSVTFNLVPVDDQLLEDYQETAVLSIVSGSGYTPYGSSASIVIIDNDNQAPVVIAGTDVVITLSENATATLPTAGVSVFLDAGEDDGSNNVWEDFKNKWNLTLDNGVTHVTNTGSSLPGIIAAYNFTGNGGGQGVSLQDMSVDTQPITLEIWFKPAQSAAYPEIGQVLWETGGGTGFGIFYNNGTVKVAHDANSDEIRTDVSSEINEFLQLVVSYDPTKNTNNLKIFVNGVQKKSSSRVDTDMCGGDASGLGTSAGGLTGGGGFDTSKFAPFEGLISIFRSYHNRILTNEEILQNYTSVALSGTEVVLDGTVNDSEGDALTTTWSLVSGPNLISITNSALIDTTAIFSTSGIYNLRLTATDGFSESSDDVTVTMIESGSNNPPVINSIWADDTILTWPQASTTLNALASDSDSSSLTYTWSKVSGPGSASFNPNGIKTSNNTTVNFDSAGDYTLRVVVFDGINSVEQMLNVTVLVTSYTLAYFSDTNGSVSGSTPQSIEEGQSGSTVTAIPNQGYVFSVWSDGSFDNPRLDTAVSADTTVTASFTQVQGQSGVVLLSTDFEGRTVSGSTAQSISWIMNGLLNPGDLTVARETPEVNSTFAGLFNTNDAQGYLAVDRNLGNEGPWSVVIPLVPSVSQLTVEEVTLQWQDFNNGGSHQSSGRAKSFIVTIVDSTQIILALTTISATEKDGTKTVSFSVPVTLVLGNTYTLKIRAENDNTTVGNNTGLNAISIKGSTINPPIGNQYSLEYTSGSNGILLGLTSQLVVESENGSAVTAVPDQGYVFTVWSDGNTNNPRVDTGVIENISVTASFTQEPIANQYSLEYTSGSNGSLLGLTSQLVVESENGSAVTAVPDQGYVFTVWSDGNTNNPRVDTGVIANISVTANFTQEQSQSGVTILSTDFEGRTVSGSSAQAIIWTSNGVTEPGELTVMKNTPEVNSTFGGFFDTNDSTGHLAVNRNIGNEGPWSVNIPLIPSSTEIQVEEVTLAWSDFNNSGGLQVGDNPKIFTVTIMTSDMTVLATKTISAPTKKGTDKVTFDMAPTLTLGNTYILNIRAENKNNTTGNNTGFDEISIIGSISGAVSSLWTPVQITTALWLDADDNSTITAEAGKLSQWNDKSGNERHATQSGNSSQPVVSSGSYNGLDVLSFDGNSDFLDVDLDFLAGVSHSSFIVTKANTYRNIYGAANGGSGSSSLHVGFKSATNYRMNYWGNDWYGPISSWFIPNKMNMLNFVWTTGSSKTIYTNSSAEGSDGSAGTISTMSGGGRISNVVGQGYYDGDIAEIIMITGNVTIENRQKIEGYLAHKWGLQNNLAGNHPYKTELP